MKKARGKKHKCAICGKPTSMGWSATVLGVYRPACAKCYERSDLEARIRIPLEDATVAELKAGLTGMIKIRTATRECQLLREELARR